MSAVIKVENLGKQYHLGQVGTGTISHDFNRWWHKVRGKEDPYLKVGEVNDRSTKGSGNLVWALKDINFEVKQGEVLGIIGKNGAGKSTLLKILSRVTGPTVGDIKVRGRIAALLEVGTGFHPELSGRENIFLNGSILGMSKQEIKSKFDEIVDFSGVERYIDTPVKRYSSGMYVRLAFAVAAHLEPEILIVDEVLAVGDAEFQKKCLGKMKDVSGQGRTVLFVSHNMNAMRTLCTNGILLVHGQLESMGKIESCIDSYSRSKSALISSLQDYEGKENYDTENVELVDYKLCNLKGEVIKSFNVYDEVYIELKYRVKKVEFDFYPNLHFLDKDDRYFFVDAIDTSSVPKIAGCYITKFKIVPYLFNVGIYSVGIAITGFPGTAVEFFINPALIFEVGEENLSLRSTPSTGEFPGISRFKLENTTKKTEG